MSHYDYTILLKMCCGRSLCTVKTLLALYLRNSDLLLHLLGHFLLSHFLLFVLHFLFNLFILNNFLHLHRAGSWRHGTLLQAKGQDYRRIHLYTSMYIHTFFIYHHFTYITIHTHDTLCCIKYVTHKQHTHNFCNNYLHIFMIEQLIVSVTVNFLMSIKT